MFVAPVGAKGPVTRVDKNTILTPMMTQLFAECESTAQRAAGPTMPANARLMVQCRA